MLRRSCYKILKRKTHEEFINEIGIKHPHIKILGTYTKAKDRILCECKRDKYQWSPTAESLSAGYGCPKCSGNNKRTHEEFVFELKDKNPNIEVLGKYTNSSTKILCKCKIDGCEWSASPSNLLHLHRGCPECGRRKISDKMTLSQEEFLRRLSNYNHKHNTFWTTNDIYKGNKSLMSFSCSKDGFTIIAEPTNLLMGCYRCHDCDKHNKEQILKDHISSNNLPIKIVGEYIDNSTKIKCKCTLCNKEYFVTPNAILSANSICRDCANVRKGISLRVPIDDFLVRLGNNNPEVKYISGYESISNRVNVQCKKCGHVWNPTAGSLVNDKNGCPICSGSKGEKKIEKILIDMNLDYSIQKTFDGLVGVGNKKIRYDFYLPQQNILIEYQGVQHEKPIDFSGRGEEFASKSFKIQQEHDKRKREYARVHNINLLEIWYWDYENIEKILTRELK